MACRGKAPQKNGGFSLMEMLVVLSLLGLLFTVLFSGLGFGFSSWRREKAHLAADDEIRSTQSLLRRSLQQAYPYFIKGGDMSQSGHVDFAGSTRRIEFLAPSPAAMEQAGRAREILDIQTGNEGLTLSLSIRPELSTGAQPKREDLVSGLQSAEFSYFGKSPDGATSGWQKTWEGRTALPDLIKISVTFLDAARPSWPELILHPRNATDVSCVYDSLTKYCRGRS